MSKYKLVADQIRQRIDDGEFHYGKRMPTINELATMYGVSHMTIKKSLELLSQLGYVDRKQGSGIYVKMNAGTTKKNVPLAGNSSRFPKGSLTSKVIHFDIIHPSEKVARKLQVKKDSFVYDIERIRIYKDRPIIIEYVYMPINVIPGLTESILEDSIYKYIRQTLKRTISSSSFTITGVRPNEEDMRQLHLESSDFLMQIVQSVYFDDGTAFEYSVDRHLPEVFAYSNIETEIL